jgi:hypothetical protein
MVTGVSVLLALPALIALLVFVVIGVCLLFRRDDDRGRFR